MLVPGRGDGRMAGSTRYFRGVGWIGEIALACLGAGGLLISGCSTAAVSDSQSSANGGRQVTSARDTTKKRSSPLIAGGKKPAKRVDSKDSPGKARISDLDPETRVQVAAAASRKKAAAEASP